MILKRNITCRHLPSVLVLLNRLVGSYGLLWCKANSSSLVLTFGSIIAAFGFCSKSALFIFKSNHRIIMLLLHIDVMIITICYISSLSDLKSRGAIGRAESCSCRVDETNSNEQVDQLI